MADAHSLEYNRSRTMVVKVYIWGDVTYLNIFCLVVETIAPLMPLSVFVSAQLALCIAQVISTVSKVRVRDAFTVSWEH